ncbi:MAG: UDP-3-O-acyl-N-acetylglucosamine deacetylase [Candidatus Sericytochromatia bacterium]
MSPHHLEPTQHWTLAQPAFLKGIGLHTGQPGQIALFPHPRPGIWVGPAKQAQRLDWRCIEDTRLCTRAAGVMTWEHLLAALTGMGVSAVRIEVDGPEIPILDGSATPFVEALQTAGLTALPLPRHVYHLKQAWQWRHGDIEITAAPATRLEIDYQIHYTRSQGVLSQRRHFVWSPETFAAELASARTFAFATDVADLLASARARGGSLANALILEENGLPRNGLRFADEPVRHKILDLLGDLTLLGAPLQAHVRVVRGGHQAHVTMVKTLQEQALLSHEREP